MLFGRIDQGLSKIKYNRLDDDVVWHGREQVVVLVVVVVVATIQYIAWKRVSFAFCDTSVLV